MRHALRLIVVLLYSIAMPGAAHPAANDDAARLQAMVQNKDYLEFEQALGHAQLSPDESALFRGILANRKNRPEESIQLLEPLAQKLAAGPASWQEMEMLKSLADDYAKTFAYAKSENSFLALLRRYRTSLNQHERRTAEERMQEMHILRNALPQTVAENSPAVLPLTRNKFGLFEIPVTANGKSESWVIDTGAGNNVVTLTTARRIGLKILEGQATTEDLNGLPVGFRIGILNELKVGNTILHNVELAITADEHLKFADYQIQGLVGFQVQTALPTMTFSADGHFAINGETAAGPSSEMFVEETAPVVEAEVQGSPLLFTLDTGATASGFGRRFYRLMKAKLGLKKEEKSGSKGAGGTRPVRVYKTTDLPIVIGGQQAVLKQASITAQSLGGLDLFFGNLGQDILGQFKSYTVDFGSMKFTATK
jgi:predicted aspartyl protease